MGSVGSDDGTDNPLVSVVIPTFDRPSFLAEAVESVLAQTYDPIEVHVVDDGSRTPAESALDDRLGSLPPSLSLHRHEENRGANAARNTGIEAARGLYIAFLDDDDRWAPEKIERQVHALERASADVGIAFTGARHVDPSGTVTNVVIPPATGDFTVNLVRGGDYGPFSTVMVRADVVNAAGPPDERFPCLQDREWYFRIAQVRDYTSIGDPLATIRRITGPQISDAFSAKRDIACPLLIEKHRDRVSEDGPGAERRFLASLYVSVAVSGIVNGRYQQATRYLARAIRQRPTWSRPYLCLLVALGGRFTHGPTSVVKGIINRFLYGLRHRSPGRE